MIWQNVIDALYESAERLRKSTREEAKAGEWASATTAGTAAIVLVNLAEALEAGIAPSSAQGERNG